jgi:hypothetical protein
MGLIANLRRLRRKLNGMQTLYDYYLSHDNHIPEGIVIKDDKEREFITGRLEVVCKEEVGIQVYPTEHMDEVNCIALVPSELKKYFVLPGN